MAVEVELKIKTGPGVIIGNRKFAVVNNTIDIVGIQFSDPGEYVISVVANDPQIENTEFTINILPEEEVIPQEDNSESSEEPLVGRRPIITQIDQPTYKLKPIEFDSIGNIEDDVNISNSTGFIPLFSYNDSPIEGRYIKKMTIFYEDFVPKCEVVLIDSLGLINSPKTTPLNDTKFDIFLNSGSDVLKSIHLKFKLEINQKNKSGTNTITGILDIPDFYKIGYKSYKGTSFESLRRLCKDIQLGFNSNIENTNDSMTWRRNGIPTRQFIRNILDHSYISDDSFMIGYIDYYWSFNYVDIEKEWKRDISEDVGLISQGLSSKSEPQSDKIAKLILSNDQSSKGSPFYISNVIINNNSTLQTTQKGSFTVSKTYDRLKKQFLKFNIDSLTSNNKEQVVLKGSPSDKTDLETNFRTAYGGKIDTTNVHENWSYSVEQNKRNLINLSNITLKADLPNPNYNLYKFQKVRISYINQKETVSNPEILDERISGEWIIIDIRFIWNGNSLKQSIICTRKELGKTTEEKQTQVNEEDRSINNSEINENPIEPGNTNEEYEIGRVYTLQGSDGVRYLYTITRLDDNGIDVIGDIKREDGQNVIEDTIANKSSELKNIIFNVQKDGVFSSSQFGELRLIGESGIDENIGFDFGDEDDLSDLLLDDEFREDQFEGDEESFNEIVDEPPGPNPDEGEQASPVDPNSKLLSKVKSNYYIIDSSDGLAGRRLRKIMSGLESYLSKQYPGTKIGFNGVMRDLVASTYPSNPARAVASLHGAGLAIDVTFKIPGNVWNGIGDNKNLANDQKLSKLIYDYVKSQGDITWGGEWGTKDGTKAQSGVIKGLGIIEYHHFEIKAGKIIDYWRPFKDEILKLGVNFDKLNKVGRGSELEKLNKILLRSVNILS